jgi:hypothetical protein
MKQLLVLVMLFSIVFPAAAQLKAKADCSNFILKVDLTDGKVNGIRPNFPLAEIKQKLICSTSTEEEGTSARCGAGIFFKDRDLSFYTDRDYIEVGEKFKGELSPKVLGTARGSLFNTLGNPKIKDATWDAYQTSYGLLILHYNKTNKVYKVQFTTQGADVLNLCD